MTAHKSKGLEFETIFLLHVTDKHWGNKIKKELIKLPHGILKTKAINDENDEEERRLFYVGMTRAKKHLFLTLAKNYGGIREKKPSGYVGETGIKIQEVSEKDAKVGEGQIGLFGVESGFRQPKAEKIKAFVPKTVSYSAINTYEECPLKYKYSYVLNIPQAPTSALTFGDTIHKTLKEFHSRLLFEPVSFKDLLEIYQKNWDPTGYKDAEHREAQFEAGKVLLKNYYGNPENQKAKPIELEKWFNIWVDGTKFNGKIDRIDKLSSGGVEIIDYKTGSPKDQKYVDADEQVAFYSIGAKEALGYEPKKLSMYFLESGEKITTTRTSKQLEEQKEKAVKVVGDIKKGKFEASPGMHCNWCAYREICPFAFKG